MLRSFYSRPVFPFSPVSPGLSATGSSLPPSFSAVVGASEPDSGEKTFHQQPQGLHHALANQSCTSGTHCTNETVDDYKVLHQDPHMTKCLGHVLQPGSPDSDETWHVGPGHHIAAFQTPSGTTASFTGNPTPTGSCS